MEIPAPRAADSAAPTHVPEPPRRQATKQGVVDENLQPPDTKSLRGIFASLKGGRPPRIKDATRDELQKYWAICLNNRLAPVFLDRMEAAIIDKTDPDHESAMKFMCLMFGGSFTAFISPPRAAGEEPPPQTQQVLPWASEDAQRIALNIVDAARRGAVLDATLAGAAAVPVSPSSATAASSAATPKTTSEATS